MSQPQSQQRQLGPVLVVDDEPLIRHMLKDGLGVLGYSVVAVEDVAAAKVYLRSNACMVVVCDYQMPGETGLDLLSYVASVHPDLPFIMLTGQEKPTLARQTILQGAVDFVSKPVTPRELARVIELSDARVERHRQRVTEFTEDVLRGTIMALVRAIDAKDPYTASHSTRVTKLALMLGSAAGLTNSELQILEYAALLHDVGKIGVPDEILRKPGTLNAEEWAIIKQHPIRSAEIVSQIPSWQPMVNIVRHHHERIDGRGYPDGLSGNAIPYFARIIAVADAYEAMTAERSYRRALSVERARQIIAEGLGAQFDAQLGALFLKIPSLP